MELDDRKVKILKAIIKNYLETGEPVGSRTISKYADLKLSSATIRNEMADLEELGYIVQPHTSAGRIPTDKGYRFYVDDMMSQKETELVNREQVVTDREKEVESMQGILHRRSIRLKNFFRMLQKCLQKILTMQRWSVHHRLRVTSLNLSSFRSLKQIRFWRLLLWKAI